jgi:hypothetical protein
MSVLQKEDKWLSVGFTTCIQQQPGPKVKKKIMSPWSILLWLCKAGQIRDQR